MTDDRDLPIIEESMVVLDGTTYTLMKTEVMGEKKLVVIGDSDGFVGERKGDALVCELTS
jgi:hypothetical protein